MPPKQIKMDLSAFLADDTFGGDSWADDFDPNDLTLASNSTGVNVEIPVTEKRGFAVPDEPPYVARITSFPDDATEDDLQHFFIEGLKLTDPDYEITNFHAPKDMNTGELKGFAFITFENRDTLVQALELNNKLMGSKQVYVSVAAPSKNANHGRRQRDDFDWGSARDNADAPSRGHRREPRNEDFDWGSARDGQDMTAPRGDRGGYRGDRPPRREPRNEDFDWGSARDDQQTAAPRNDRPPRGDRPPRRDEDFDWGSARDDQQTAAPRTDRPLRGDRPPRREPKNDDFDWGSARDDQQTATARSDRPQRGDRPPREPRNDDFDWSSARQTHETATPRGSRGFKSDRSPRQPIKDTFDWGSARDTQESVSVKKFEKRHSDKPRENRVPKPKEEDNLDWSHLRGSALDSKKTKKSKQQPVEEKKTRTSDAPKKSVFHVLQDDDEEDHEEKQEETSASKGDDGTGLAKATQKLSLDEEDGWQRV